MCSSIIATEQAAQLEHLTAHLKLAKEAAAKANIRAAKAQAEAGAMRWKFAQVKAINATLSTKLGTTQAALEAANRTIAQQHLQHLQLVAQHAATEKSLRDEQTQHFVTTERLVVTELELEATQQQQKKQLATATNALIEQKHSGAAGAASAARQHELDAAKQRAHASSVAAAKANSPRHQDCRMPMQAVATSASQLTNEATQQQHHHSSSACSKRLHMQQAQRWLSNLPLPHRLQWFAGARHPRGQHAPLHKLMRQPPGLRQHLVDVGDVMLAGE